MNQEDKTKLHNSLAMARNLIDYHYIKSLIENKKSVEALSALSKACIAMQEVSVIISKLAIRESFSEIKRDINDITNSSPKVQ